MSGTLSGAFKVSFSLSRREQMVPGTVQRLEKQSEACTGGDQGGTRQYSPFRELQSERVGIAACKEVGLVYLMFSIIARENDRKQLTMNVRVILRS